MDRYKFYYPVFHFYVSYLPFFQIRFFFVHLVKYDVVLTLSSYLTQYQDFLATDIKRFLQTHTVGIKNTMKIILQVS